MGQKVNPHGLRVGVIKDWDSRWYAREEKVGDLIVEDYNIRKYLKEKLYAAGVAKIEIERSNGKVKINLWCSRPGLLISWLQSPSAVILEPPKIKSLTVSTVSPSICHDVMGPDAMILVNFTALFQKLSILSHSFSRATAKG